MPTRTRAPGPVPPSPPPHPRPAPSHSTPVRPERCVNSPASAVSRAAGTRTAASSAIAASSRTRRYGSSTIFRFLTRGIDALLEGLDAEAFDGVDEQLAGPLAKLDIGRDHVFDDIGDFVVRHRGTK